MNQQDKHDIQLAAAKEIRRRSFNYPFYLPILLSLLPTCIAGLLIGHHLTGRKKDAVMFAILAIFSTSISWYLHRLLIRHQDELKWQLFIR
jgi:hypothetical protein